MRNYCINTVHGNVCGRRLSDIERVGGRTYMCQSYLRYQHKHPNTLQYCYDNKTHTHRYQKHICLCLRADSSQHQCQSQLFFDDDQHTRQHFRWHQTQAKKLKLSNNKLILTWLWWGWRWKRLGSFSTISLDSNPSTNNNATTIKLNKMRKRIFCVEASEISLNY
jgi:hypothetical protein